MAADRPATQKTFVRYSAAIALILALTSAAEAMAAPVDTPQPSRAPSLRSSDDMTLGEAAPAPIGFLRFCGRLPSECGLDPGATFSESAITAGERTQELLAKYYWQVAFAGRGMPDLRITPTSGQASARTPLVATPVGHYDWTVVFGGVVAAPSAPGSGTAAIVINRQTPADAAEPAQSRSTDGDATGGQLVIANMQQRTSDAFDIAGFDADAAASATVVELTPTSWDRHDEKLEFAAAASTSASSGNFLNWASKNETVVFATLPVEAVATTASTAASAEGGEAQPLLANRAAVTLLKVVNQRVNAAIRYMSDVRQYGVDDYWTLPLAAGGSMAGDCKDFVLEKRHALIAAGVPAADLSIAIVTTSWGETHAVLLVATAKGELVMDSLSSEILPWRKAPYAWVERQAPGSTLTWVKITENRRPLRSYFGV